MQEGLDDYLDNPFMSAPGIEGYTPDEGAPNNGTSPPPCPAKILNATNNRFGTNYTNNNVNSTFNYSTGAPAGQGALNLNIYGSTAGATGSYPVNWWTYVIGYGPRYRRLYVCAPFRNDRLARLLPDA